jgi:MarR family transcriptional regulator, organic hydroperoxide resistance regulator
VSDFLPLFTRASKLMRGAADDAMSRHGVRVGQNLVLAALWDADGLTPGDVAQRLGVRTPTIVKMATRMESAGLVERRRDPKDARLVRIYLTAKGRRLRESIERELRDLEARALADVSDRELRSVEKALAKIVRNLEGAEPPDEAVDELA